MSTVQSENLEPRVARVETEVRQIRQEISALGEIVQKTGDRMETAIAQVKNDIDNDRKAAAERGRISGPFVLALLVGGVSICTALATVIGLYISLVLSPIRIAQEIQATEISSLKERQHNLDKFSLDTRAQMEKMSSLNAAELSHLTHFIQMLWRRSYSEDLPSVLRRSAND